MIHFSALAFFFFSLLLSLVFLSFQVGPTGAFSSSDPPEEREGAPPTSSAPDFLVLLRSGVFRSGDHWPSRKFCPRKNGTPQSGCARNHARVQQVSSLSGWPQVPSGVTGSPLSLFSRGLAPVPPQTTSGFPFRRKTPRPMGL